MSRPLGCTHATISRLVQNAARPARSGQHCLVIEHDLDDDRRRRLGGGFWPRRGAASAGRSWPQGAPAAVARTPASITGQYLAGTAAIPVPASRRRAESGRGADHPRCARAQPEGHHRLFPAAHVDRRHRGLRFRQILADVRYPRPGRAPAFLRCGRSARRARQGSTAGNTSTRSSPLTRARSAARPARTPPPIPTPSPPIREVFAAQPAARQRGLTAQHFSFNVPGGRCDRCEGAGVLAVEMHFLPDVQVRCPACHGRRFKREVLAVNVPRATISARCST